MRGSIELSPWTAFLGGFVPTVVLNVANIYVPLPWEPTGFAVYLMSYLVIGGVVAGIGWALAESWRLRALFTFAAALGTVVAFACFVAAAYADGAFA